MSIQNDVVEASQALNVCYFTNGESRVSEERSVQRTLIEEVFEPGKKMVFLFDYGDDWQFLISCTGVEPSKTKRKVRKIVSEKGVRPIQYPDFDSEMN